MSIIIEDIRTELPFDKSIGKRNLNNITGIVVHHTAVAKNDSPSLARIQADARYHISKGWGHIAYHYMIDAEGKIYQCYDETEIGAQAGDWNWNVKTIAVCIDGDYTKEHLTPKQVAALWEFLDYMTLHRPDLPGIVKHTIHTHREVRPTPTSCPSDQIANIVNAYRV